MQDNPRRRHNVTKQMAHDAARQAARETDETCAIWYDNNRDGWRWDFINSEWLGHRTNAPKTNRLYIVM